MTFCCCYQLVTAALRYNQSINITYYWPSAGRNNKVSRHTLNNISFCLALQKFFLSLVRKLIQPPFSYRPFHALVDSRLKEQQEANF